MYELTQLRTTDAAAQRYDKGVLSIYRDDYAALYPSLYITPWRKKHDLNLKNLEVLLQSLATPMPDWLDLACGQAWHFSMFPGRAHMVGLDLSGAQLVRARSRVPDAVYVNEDMATVTFPKASFNLVTNFWAGYCYLGTHERIGTLLRKVVHWIRPGGALYFEVLLARDLESFNSSHFAGQTGFSVAPRSKDYTHWQYEDFGGRHEMTSPSLDFFLNLLAPDFNAIEARHDSAFMVHLIATGRRRDHEHSMH